MTNEYGGQLILVNPQYNAVNKCVVVGMPLTVCRTVFGVMDLLL